MPVQVTPHIFRINGGFLFFLYTIMVLNCLLSMTQFGFGAFYIELVSYLVLHWWQIVLNNSVICTHWLIVVPDARKKGEYNESHVVTSKKAPRVSWVM